MSPGCTTVPAGTISRMTVPVELRDCTSQRTSTLLALSISPGSTTLCSNRLRSTVCRTASARASESPLRNIGNATSPTTAADPTSEPINHRDDKPWRRVDDFVCCEPDISIGTFQARGRRQRDSGRFAAGRAAFDRAQFPKGQPVVRDASRFATASDGTPIAKDPRKRLASTEGRPLFYSGYDALSP